MLGHNSSQDLTANLLNNVCKDVEIEPRLLLVTGKNLENQTGNRRNETRADIRSTGFWARGQQAFTDKRVFNPNANSYPNSALPQCYTQNKREKKRWYNERVLQIEYDSFTPLVFLVYGAMQRECSTFRKILPKVLSGK